MLLGLFTAAAGLVWYAQLDAGGSYAADALGPNLLVAFAMGNVFVSATLVATAGIAAEEQGSASGIFNSSQQIGGALGLAILTTVAADQTASSAAAGVAQAGALVDGYSAALYVAAGMALLALAVVAATLRRRDVADVNPAALVPA
jgi:hypothetical protein